ncbi:MAG: aldehyde ferredoxin oxidoreductase [Candidatus Schekmanbacteria bacterium]|nr:aldehyde ferredoxin oxidoreductase [Candidatus Schekmanbacteria bacterium]
MAHLLRALHIDAATGYYRLVKFESGEVIGPVDYGFKVYQERNGLCIGGGLLAGSIIPGSNRLIFSGRSPHWEGFYVSTMGGAALVFDDLGINFIVIEGKCPQASILKLKRDRSEMIDIDIEPLPALQEIWKSYKNLKGTLALQSYLYDRYLSHFSKSPRILVTGPAALHTNFGAICSSQITSDGISNAECWAGRGGFGSKLLREHNIAAIIFGGTYIDDDLMDKTLVDRYFLDKYQMKMKLKDFEVTKKYRFDPKFDTGGTFGVNFTSLKELLFSFNYSSIYLTDAERLEIHERFIKAHYLKQFNSEIIAEKSFFTCGEPCVAVCKKVRGEYKKDYEPYEALGPNCGIFDQRAAEEIVYYADSMGFDAIEIGGMVSWVMELLSKGIIKKDLLRLSCEPVFDYKNFRIIEDSQNNARLSREIIDMILFKEWGKNFRLGMRQAAKELDESVGINTIDYAVFNAFGEYGTMVPNQYWTPGMFSPMSIMGKYFEYYGYDYHEPRELGRLNAERMVKEISIDNAGMCRFHRGWAEDIIEEIFNDYFAMKVDFFAHHLKLVSAMNESNHSHFWESSRIIDIVGKYLEKHLQESPSNEELKKWCDGFRNDKRNTARRYWKELRDGMNEVFSTY